MHNGRIAYFEDNTILAETVKRAVDVFSDGRHQVVAQAADLGGALAVLDQIANGDIDANVVLSDCNLLSGLGGGHDARRIMEHVAELNLNVRTIIMSSYSAQDMGIASVDASLLKDGAVGTQLIEVLDALPEVE